MLNGFRENIPYILIVIFNFPKRIDFEMITCYNSSHYVHKICLTQFYIRGDAGYFCYFFFLVLFPIFLLLLSVPLFWIILFDRDLLFQFLYNCGLLLFGCKFSRSPFCSSLPSRKWTTRPNAIISKMTKKTITWISKNLLSNSCWV